MLKITIHLVDIFLSSLSYVYFVVQNIFSASSKSCTLLKHHDQLVCGCLNKTRTVTLLFAQAPKFSHRRLQRPRSPLRPKTARHENSRQISLCARGSVLAGRAPISCERISSPENTRKNHLFTKQANNIELSKKSVKGKKGRGKT